MQCRPCSTDSSASEGCSKTLTPLQTPARHCRGLMQSPDSSQRKPSSHWLGHVPPQLSSVPVVQFDTAICSSIRSKGRCPRRTHKASLKFQQTKSRDTQFAKSSSPSAYKPAPSCAAYAPHICHQCMLGRCSRWPQGTTSRQHSDRDMILHN